MGLQLQGNVKNQLTKNSNFLNFVTNKINFNTHPYVSDHTILFIPIPN